MWARDSNHVHGAYSSGFAAAQNVQWLPATATHESGPGFTQAATPFQRSKGRNQDKTEWNGPARWLRISFALMPRDGGLKPLCMLSPAKDSWLRTSGFGSPEQFTVQFENLI